MSSTNIYNCQICYTSHNTAGKYAKHIKDHHKKYTIKEYYDSFVKTENEGVCHCGEQTRWISINQGYRPCCSRSCAAKNFRKNLKNDSEKFKKFTEKVRKNQSKIWKRRSDRECQKIFNRSANTNSRRNQLLTEQERIEKYSRYYTMSPSEWERLNKIGAEQLINLSNEGKTGYMKTLKGKYKPANPQKYDGDPTNIIYRSSYELKYMKWCDHNQAVIQWQSEEFSIPYRHPIDGRVHRYFPDFLVKIKTSQDIVETWVIEIKPMHQVKEPKAQNRKTKKYLTEVKTYAINRYKWDYAIEWCKDRGYKFIILTEKELGIS